MSKEVLLNKLEKQFSYYELVDEMQETINFSKIVEFLENEKDQQITDLEAKLAEKEKKILDTEEKWIKWGKQDKISFCIEQLEKVLNFVDGRTYLAQYIKEQIEELKKEMK